MRSIQRELVAKGFAPGYPDGDWGANTTAAFEDFERVRDLPVDGLADPDALRALFGSQPEIQRVSGTDLAAPTLRPTTSLPPLALAVGALGGFALAALAMWIARARRRHAAFARGP